jgi:hypothetical protein
VVISESSFPLSPREILTVADMTGIAMLFAGFTSAYIVLRGVPSWEHIAAAAAGVGQLP